MRTNARYKPERKNREYRETAKGKRHSEIILSCVSAEEWQTGPEIHEKYRQLVDNPYHRGALYNILNDLEAIGEIETKGATSDKRYRRTDQPVEEVRERDNPHPQTEGVPDWLETRIDRIAAEKAEDYLEERIGQIVDDIIQKEMKEKLERHRTLSASSQEGNNRAQSEIKKRHKAVLLDIINSEGEIDAGDLYDEYENLVDNPRGKRAVRDYLQELREDARIKAEGAGPHRTYHILRVEDFQQA